MAEDKLTLEQVIEQAVAEAMKPYAAGHIPVGRDAHLWIGRRCADAVAAAVRARGSPEWDEMRARHLAKLKEEFERYSTGGIKTDYGRGWNGGLEEAATIAERVLA